MKSIFDRLAAEVRSKGEEHAAPVSLDAERFIGGDGTDEDALQHAQILDIERVPGIGVIALLRWRSRYVFSLPSALFPTVGPDEDVAEVISNAGLSSLLFAHAETEVIVPDVFLLIESIFGDSGKYELDLVAPFFSSYTHYWARHSLDSSTRQELWSRCQALSARCVVKQATQKWSPECKAWFERASSGGAARVAGSSLLAAAVAGTWAHTFLEVYRAVEALFTVICVEDLMAKLPPDAATAPRGALVDALEETLQWRLRQDATLSRLIAKLASADADQIGTMLGVPRSAVADTLYKARNRVAHGALMQAPVSNREALLGACLLLVSSAYDLVDIHDLWLASA